MAATRSLTVWDSDDTEEARFFKLMRILLHLAGVDPSVAFDAVKVTVYVAAKQPYMPCSRITGPSVPQGDVTRLWEC